MSNFAAYALVYILQSAGLPRKSGFLGRQVIVQAKALDQAVDQLIKIGVALGVGRPQLALRLITSSFDRDWTATSAQELVDFLNVDHIVTASPDQPPWRVIPGSRFSELGKEEIPYNWLGQPQLALHYTGWFAQALLWGVLHREQGRIALDADRKSLEERAAWWKGQGLDVSPDTWPSNDEEVFRICEELVKSFEAERGSLPNPPVALSEESRIAHALAEDA